MENLEKHAIAGHDSVYYIPNFVTPEEEAYLIRKITETPRVKWKHLANRRLQLWGGEITSKGNLLAQPMPPFFDKYPDIIARLRATGAFASSPHGAPNHVILNEYLTGQGIMPHEDGPRYFPVVATLSLGSHCIFEYYQYEGSDKDSSSSTSQETGKIINNTPVLVLLLEPQSLVITMGKMYTYHLHGIRGQEEDRIVINQDTMLENCTNSVYISNFHLLGDSALKDAIRSGEKTLKRETRYSLTCRDVERVSTFSSRR